MNGYNLNPEFGDYQTVDLNVVRYANEEYTKSMSTEK